MDGALLDLERIGEALRARGAQLVVDASQSLGALPFDVRRIQPDFLITCGYKWMQCPYSISFLYVAPGRQGGRPIEENPMNREGARAFARLADYTEDYGPGAIRFDVGERANFTLLPGALVALEKLVEWTPDWIQSELRAKTAQVAEAGKKLGLEVLPEERRAGHFLGLTFPEGVPEDAPKRLADQKIYVSVRGRSIRVTPHLYNDAEDLERLIGALQRL
jgi:selenocysteine lyase/cysteine desulfurase